MELTLGEHAPRLLYGDGNRNKPAAWSPDGRFLLFKRDEQAIFALPASGDGKPVLPSQHPYVKGRFQFSPDGHWLAYMSMDSGRPEIYISSFPAMRGPRQVSSGGGCTPVWKKDGKELFYMAGPRRMMSVDVKAGSSLETGPPKVLVQPAQGEGTIYTESYCIGQYGVSENGQKFLIVEIPPAPIDDGRIHVVTHWDAALHH